MRYNKPLSGRHTITCWRPDCFSLKLKMVCGCVEAYRSGSMKKRLGTYFLQGPTSLKIGAESFNFQATW